MYHVNVVETKTIVALVTSVRKTASTEGPAYVALSIGVSQYNIPSNMIVVGSW